MEMDKSQGMKHRMRTYHDTPSEQRTLELLLVIFRKYLREQHTKERNKVEKDLSENKHKTPAKAAAVNEQSGGTGKGKGERW